MLHFHHSYSTLRHPWRRRNTINSNHGPRKYFRTCRVLTVPYGYVRYEVPNPSITRRMGSPENRRKPAVRFDFRPCRYRSHTLGPRTITWSKPAPSNWSTARKDGSPNT